MYYLKYIIYLLNSISSASTIICRFISNNSKNDAAAPRAAWARPPSSLEVFEGRSYIFSSPDHPVRGGNCTVVILPENEHSIDNRL